MCSCDSRKNTSWGYESELDSWHDLCDLGLILSPLNITFLIWNLVFFSQPPASLKAEMNKGGGGEEGSRRGERKWGDQNLLEHVWEAGRDTRGRCRQVREEVARWCGRMYIPAHLGEF